MQRILSVAVILLLTASSITACVDKVPEMEAEVPADHQPLAEPQVESVAQSLSGKVTETMNAAGYTYVQVDAGDETFWAAAPTFAVEIGDEVTVPPGMPMENFHSSALDRDFDVVFFVEGVRVGAAETGDAEVASSGLPTGHPSVGSDPSIQSSGIDTKTIRVPEGGKRIAEIISNGDDLAGKTVSFRGKVVKFNANIMDTNWLHVQDGTGEPGKNDLTVTTDDVAGVGDIVLVTGKVATDKDFGYGYSYEVIVEDAKVRVE